MKLTQYAHRLEDMGLTPNEARAYLALIELGSGTIGNVSMATNIKRPTLYLVLDELRKKGLVTKIPNPKKQIFSAKDPQEFITGVTQKVSQFERILPELRALQSRDESKTLLFENMQGMREALNYRFDELKNSETVGFFATADDASEEQLALLRKWSKKAAGAGISFRGIVPKDNSMQSWRNSDQEEGRQMKEIDPQEYASTVSIDINELFVRIMSFEHERITIIDDRETAKALKAVFEMLWNRM